MESRRYIKLKNYYTLAIRGNIEDKYRKGELIELPNKGDVVILGDLHGNRENFRKVIEAAQLETHPLRHIILQEPTHTYEATEDKSYLLIEDIVAFKSKFPHQVHMILGNHELSEITEREILKGGICYNILFREGMKREYGAYYRDIRELMIDFMKTLPLACISYKNKIFISHSTPERKYIPYYSLKFFKKGDNNSTKYNLLVEKLVWGRDLSQEAADEFAKQIGVEILIVGHTACKRGYQVPNKRHIILDSKGDFGTTLHFRLDKVYTHKYLVKNCIKYINKSKVEKLIGTKELILKKKSKKVKIIKINKKEEEKK